MSIFQKKTGSTDYFDQITIGGYQFDAVISVREKRGDPSAIHCGRIITFELEHEGELLTYFADGKWYLPEAETLFVDDPFLEVVMMARDILIAKWSNYIKFKDTE